MRHWERQITFAIDGTRDRSDSPTGDDLADENHAALDLGRLPAAHVKAEIHFVKIAMKWKSDAKHSRVQKTKSNQAYESFSAPRIYFGAGRNIRQK